MIRTKGEAGTGDVVEAVKHQRAVMSDIRRAAAMSDEELYSFAKEIQAPYHLLKETARLKRLPVVSFAAGGVATPADAALMMQLGCDGVFVGSGICEYSMAWGRSAHASQNPLKCSILVALATFGCHKSPPLSICATPSAGLSAGLNVSRTCARSVQAYVPPLS